MKKFYILKKTVFLRDLILKYKLYERPKYKCV